MINQIQVREHHGGQTDRYQLVASVAGLDLTSSPVTSAQVNAASTQLKTLSKRLRAVDDEHVNGLLELLGGTDQGSRPSKERLMMGVAHLMALRSTCLRLRVGAVICDADLTTIHSVGYNGGHAGGPNRCDDATAVGACGCLHAEDNALVKLRTEERGLQVFTTHSPCSACAKRIINQGRISHVHHAVEYRSQAGLDLLRDAGLYCRNLG